MKELLLLCWLVTSNNTIPFVPNMADTYTTSATSSIQRCDVVDSIKEAAIKKHEANININFTYPSKNPVLLKVQLDRKHVEEIVIPPVRYEIDEKRIISK